MAEYIEREAALRANCYFCSEHLKDDSPCGEKCADYMKFMEIPAADVRPVVLCRDCVHFSEVMYGGTQFEYGYCDRWEDGTKMNPDDFCSHGEKREES